MDEPAFPGCALKCRPIGVIQGQQGDKKQKVRNDRIIAVEQDAHSWADIQTIDDGVQIDFIQGRRARVTFSKISEARAVQMKGLGFSLWRSM